MILGLCTLALASTAACACPDPVAWPHYARYVQTFVTDEGRVREPSAGDRTTSEGQAYGLFFALVANDRPRFERLLGWTRDNLAAGDLRRNLPGWLWGQAPARPATRGKKLAAGQPAAAAWRLLDRNPASDADLWMAYSLLEGARLWQAPELETLGRAILARVVAREVVDLPRLGPMVLPGPVGFELARGRRWRLNPSYLPLQLLRRFSALSVPGPWPELPGTVVRLVREVSPAGFVPDWVLYDRERGFSADPVTGPLGSYDAIRVYLWAGMLAHDEPLKQTLLAAVKGPLEVLLAGASLPEKVDVSNGQPRGQDQPPPGFLAVMLPLLRDREDRAPYQRLQAALDESRQDGLYGDPATYYDQNLVLFARGFDEGRFRFDASGALRPEWESRCCAN
jgi:endoglucanase